MPKDSPDLFEGLPEAPSPLVVTALGIWNEFAARNKWKPAKVLDSGRRAAMKRAVGDYGGVAGFQAALEKVQRNPFVMGQVKPKDDRRPFVANLDWFIRPVTVRKVLEDFYESGDAPTRSEILTKAPAVNWAVRLDRYKPGGFWAPGDGPRPEQRGPHLAPAERIEEWRARYKIRNPDQDQESAEERMASSVRSYRAHGMWERANAVEVKLAAIQGRPAELLAAPGARDPDDVPRATPAPARGHPRGNNITDVVPEWTGDVPEGAEHEAG